MLSLKEVIQPQLGKHIVHVTEVYVGETSRTEAKQNNTSKTSVWE